MTSCTSKFLFPSQNGIKFSKILEYEISYTSLDSDLDTITTAAGTASKEVKQTLAANVLSGTFATCGFQIELDRKREQLITHVRFFLEKYFH